MRGRLAEACERFGIAYDTAAQATRVSAAFPESCMRIQDLTFNHHQIVANHPQAGEHHARRLREADAKWWTLRSVAGLLAVDESTVSRWFTNLQTQDSKSDPPPDARVQRECDAETVEAVIRDDPEALAAFREAMKHQGKRTDLVSNRNEVEVQRPAGTTRAYSISRVQRECDPDTVAAVMAGEHHARRLTAPARPFRWARLQARAAMLFGGHEIIGSPARVQNCERPSISAWSRSRRPTSAASRAAWPSVRTSWPRMKRSTAAGEMPAARARSAEECSLQAIA